MLLSPRRMTVSKSLLRPPLLSSSCLLQSSVCQFSLFTGPNHSKRAKSDPATTTDNEATQVKAKNSTIKTTKHGRWSLDEDESLLRGLLKFEGSGVLQDGIIGKEFWNNIVVNGRRTESKRERWGSVLKPLLVRELAGTRGGFIGDRLVDQMIKEKTNIQSRISWRVFTVKPQFTGFTSINLSTVFHAIKQNTAEKYGLDRLSGVTLVDIKRYLETREPGSPALDHHEKEQQLRVDLAYKIGLLKPGASLMTLKKESGDNLRCEHCRMTFRSERNLEKHYKSCKIRNNKSKRPKV